MKTRTWRIVDELPGMVVVAYYRSVSVGEAIDQYLHGGCERMEICKLPEGFEGPRRMTITETEYAED